MRAYCITLAGHAYSERVSERCIRTAAEIGGLEVERFLAVGADVAEAVMRCRGLRWTWGSGSAGLKHHPYPGRLAPRLGCAMSHLLLWERCADWGEPLMVLEHDAMFLRRYEPFEFKAICQLNDPAGATRKGAWWSAQMEKRGPGVWPKTRLIQDPTIPDGLAGNSAYVIQPHAAAHLCELYRVHGVWPNDATMCAQLVPDLEELYPFLTRVEQTESTTS